MGRTAFAAGIGLLLSASLAQADSHQCDQTLDDYNTAIKELADALRDYSHCVSHSKGNDDCSAEFSALNGAQDNFETAVAAYQSDCADKD